MSTLRKCLKHPATYLLVLASVAGAIIVDALRPPEYQQASRVYVALVREYQKHASPSVSSIVRCRFRPTCSEYSIEAVRKFGILEGAKLSAIRLWRCRRDVQLATSDPVP